MTQKITQIVADDLKETRHGRSMDIKLEFGYDTPTAALCSSTRPAAYGTARHARSLDKDRCQLGIWMAPMTPLPQACSVHGRQYMGGYFGAISHRDVGLDVFFGADYHSHLGTRRGGMVIYDAERPGSSGRSTTLKTPPSAPSLRSDLAEFHGYSRHRLHQRHRPPAPAGALPSGPVRHHHRGHHQQRRGADRAAISPTTATSSWP